VLDEDLRTIGEPASLVGAFESARYDDIRFQMRPGTTVLLHTDGVTEARHDHEFYGEERLMRLLRHNTEPADVLVGRILGDVLRFQNEDARDDIALVALHIPASSS
jgi:sigma-B regulation protein RsbU (phosphoserine phosphatase)